MDIKNAIINIKSNSYEEENKDNNGKTQKIYEFPDKKQSVFENHI